MSCNSAGSTTSSSDSITIPRNNQTSDTVRLVDTEAGSSDDKMNGNKIDATIYFISEAGGVMEVQLGQLSKTHAASQAVKEFGAMMVPDHSKANAGLKGIATEEVVTIHAELPNKFKRQINDLTAKKGAEFSKYYTSMMVEDHAEYIKMFERCARNEGGKADVKAFVAKTLPALYKHCDAARKKKMHSINNRK